MAQVYSTYEAKAKFSEILRKVMKGQRVIISLRGEEVAEIRPLEAPEAGLRAHLTRLEDHGLVSAAPTARVRKIGPLTKRPGALRRFLDSRE